MFSGRVGPAVIRSLMTALLQSVQRLVRFYWLWHSVQGGRHSGGLKDGLPALTAGVVCMVN